MPKDFDERANLCASPGLTAVPPLAGGEEVALLNLTPGGETQSFALPKIRTEITLEVAGRTRETRAPYVDTIILDTAVVPGPAQVVVEMVWRAVFKAPRRMKDAKVTIAEREDA